MRSLGVGPVDRYLTAQAMLDDMREVQEGEAEVMPHGFAEEAARVMAATAAAAVAGGTGAAPPTQASRQLDEPAPIIEPEEQPGRPRRVWPWVLVTILILALASAAYAIASDRGATPRPQFGTVPEVVGLTEAKAIAKIQAAGFGYRVEARQPSLNVRRAMFCAKTPRAGRSSRRAGRSASGSLLGQARSRCPTWSV